MPRSKTKLEPIPSKHQHSLNNHQSKGKIRRWLTSPFTFLWQRKQLLVVLIIASAFLIFIANRVYQARSPKEMETFTVERHTITKIIEASGQVEASQSANLKFQTSGQLAWLGVAEGDRVKKWQAVASLDKRKLQKELEKYLSTYLDQRYDTDFTRRSHNVFSNEFDKFFMTEAVKETLLRDQLSLDKTVLDVEIQDITNQLATLISPIDGLVTSILTQTPGINVLTTDTIATIVNPMTTYFEAEVDEADIGNLLINQSAEIILDAFPDESIIAKVALIDFQASISEGSTIFKVRLALPQNGDQIKYRLGMTGDVNIIVAEKPDVLVLPSQAIIYHNGSNYVDVLSSSGRPERRLIEIGLQTDDSVEISQGVQEGEIVIIPQ